MDGWKKPELMPGLRQIEALKAYRVLESGPILLLFTHDGVRANK